MQACCDDGPRSTGGGPRRTGVRFVVPLAVLLLSAGLSGCAALTNPLADGIPVRKVPPELLTPPKEGQTIPLNLLGQPRPDTYRLAPGDVVGVYIDGILGERNQPLPMHAAPQLQARDQRRLPAAVGFPVAVQEDGTLPLPLVAPLAVEGRSIAEVRDAIRDLYAKKERLKLDTDRVLVSLLQPRQYHVVVMREESAGYVPNPDGPLTTSKVGTGHVVDLPAYENDVLHALAQTGGPPGLDAYKEVVIFRNCFHDAQGGTALVRDLQACPSGHGTLRLAGSGGSVTRIPLHLPAGTEPAIRPEDVILQTGDVVYIAGRHDEVFYTAGLLPPGAHLLPRDHSLDVIEAIAQVRGPLLNGAFGGSNLSGTLIAPGIGNPSPSLLVVLRRTPGGGQLPIVVDLNRALTDAQERIRIQAGDVLLLQEMPGEAFARYFTQTFLNFDLFWQVIHERFATGVIDVSAPDRLSGRVGTVNIDGRR